MPDVVDHLIDYCARNNRVCPQPLRWNELYELLPNRKRIGVRFEPPAPLILAAWWETSNEDKRDRLVNHIRWASQHGEFETVNGFLQALEEHEWHHIND